MTWIERALAFATLPLMAGCVLDGSLPSDPPPNEAVAEARERFSSAGIERVVPIRFVHIRSDVAGLNATAAAHYDAIHRLNAVFRSAGTQFEFYSAEGYYMPKTARYNRWVDAGGNPCAAGETCYLYDSQQYCWGVTSSGYCAIGNVNNIGAEFVQIPWLSNASFAAGKTFTLVEWLAAVPSYYGPDEAMVIWVQDDDPNAALPMNLPWGSATAGSPDRGRYFNVSQKWLAPQYGLAHETGHYFALGHTDGPAVGIYDPSTNQPSKAADFWDLIFCPGALLVSHEYYHSRSEATNSTRCTDTQMQAIDRGSGSNCTVDLNNGGFTTCRVTTDSAVLFGLGIPNCHVVYHLVGPQRRSGRHVRVWVAGGRSGGRPRA